MIEKIKEINLSIGNAIMIAMAVFVSVVILILQLLASNQLEQALSRGNYLVPHLARFNGYKEKLGNHLKDNAAIVANKQEIIDLVKSGQGKKKLHEVFKLLSASKNISFLMVVKKDRDKKTIVSLLGKKNISEYEINKSIFITDILNEHNKTEMVYMGDTLFFLGGHPVQNYNGKVIGAVILGNLVNNIFTYFSKRSNREKEKRHHFAFLLNDRVIESSIARKDFNKLTRAIEERKTIKEGNTDVNVFYFDANDVANKEYDYEEDKVLHWVFAGNKKTFGKLAMFRNRTTSKTIDKLRELNINILLVAIFAIILSVALGYFLSRFLILPLNNFISVTSGIAMGDENILELLKHRFPVKGPREIKELAPNLNKIFENLEYFFSQIRSSGISVGTSAKEISITARELYTRARKQTVKAEDVSAAINEMNRTIQLMSEQSEKVSQQAKRSSESVGEANKVLHEIRVVVDDVSKQIKGLGDVTKRIGNIVETISQISERTSMLALNASIEATHAGEHGKGFAVVADEVSELSTRVERSAKQIEDQILQIRTMADRTISVMDNGTIIVDDGVTRVNNTINDINYILDIVQEMGIQIKEQALVSESITQNMVEVLAVVRNGLNSSKQTMEETEHLKNLGEELIQAVHHFTQYQGKFINTQEEEKTLITSDEENFEADEGTDNIDEEVIDGLNTSEEGNEKLKME